MRAAEIYDRLHMPLSFFHMQKQKNTAERHIKKDTTLQEYCAYLNKPGRIFWTNFLAGTARGLGFLIGATLVLILGAFVLEKILSSIPIVGNFFTWLDLWLKENLDSYKSITQIQ